MLPLANSSSKPQLFQESSQRRKRRAKRRAKAQHQGASQLVNSLKHSKLILLMCSGVVLTFLTALFSDVPTDAAFSRGDVMHRITNASSSPWMTRFQDRLKRIAHRTTHAFRRKRTTSTSSVNVHTASTFHIHLHGSRSVQTPIHPGNFSLTAHADYDHLQLKFLKNDGETRQITDVRATGPEYKSEDHRAFYAQDDLYEITADLDDENPRYMTARKDHKRLCRYPKARNHHYPMCNPFHELGFDTLIRHGESKWVGGGEYREVFMVNHSHNDDLFVFKEMGIVETHFSYNRLEEYIFEGLVAAITTPHELYAEMYGFCAFSIFGQYFNKGSVEDFAVASDRCKKDINWGDDDDDDDAPLVSENNLTAEQKVQYALNMAESIAVMHNNPQGVLIHNDIQLSQFLVAADGKSVKFNDFNRADILMWDESENQFCKYRNGEGQGDWRSPEEYEDKPLDESIDIFSLGNSFYSLLTGVYPFPNMCEYKKVQESVKKGKRSYLDQRWKNESAGEGVLLEIIEKCWEQDPASRPSATDLVRSLRTALKLQKNEVSGPSPRNSRI